MAFFSWDQCRLYVELIQNRGCNLPPPRAAPPEPRTLGQRAFRPERKWHVALPLAEWRNKLCQDVPASPFCALALCNLLRGEPLRRCWQFNEARWLSPVHPFVFEGEWVILSWKKSIRLFSMPYRTRRHMLAAHWLLDAWSQQFMGLQ